MVKMAPYGIAVAVVASTLVLVGLGAAVTSDRDLIFVRGVVPILAGVVSVLTIVLGALLWEAHRALATSLIGFVLLLCVPMGDSAGFVQFTRFWRRASLR